MAHTELGFWILIAGGNFELTLFLREKKKRDLSFIKILDLLKSIKENSTENCVKI